MENLSYLPDSLGEMKYLPENPHTITLQFVLDKHKSRIVEPSPINASNEDETPESIIAIF